MNALSRYEGDRISNPGADVVDVEVGVVIAKDPLERDSVLDELEKVLDRDPPSCHVWLAEVSRRVNVDSIDHWPREPLLHWRLLSVDLVGCRRQYGCGHPAAGKKVPLQLIWSIDYPLHSVEIRHSSHAFSWLKRGTDEYEKFMRDLSRFLTTIDVVGLACVVDRPGYDARYREKYGRRQWHLCQTAFSIVMERAAKYARDNGRKLRVMPERSSRDDERRILTYFECLREKGTPFDSQSSSLYAPLHADQFCDTLYELRFKGKSSPMAQIADLYLWPLAIAGYDECNRAYGLLRTAGRLIESRLPESQRTVRGTKYSCFELVHQQIRER